MNFQPTSIFLQALEILQISLDSSKKLTRDEFNEKIEQLDNFDEDEKFEISEQFSTMKKHQNTTFQRNVQEDKINFSNFEEIPSGCAPIAITRDVKPIFNAIPKSTFVNPIAKNCSKKIPVKKSFNEMLNMISSRGQKILLEKNLREQTVFAYLTQNQLENLKLSRDDEKVVKQLMVQCRSTMIKKRIETSKKQEMPKNCITDRLPIKSIVTIRALKKTNMLCPIKLYISTDISEIMKVFSRFPSIPESDKKNILAGVALARYTHRNC